MTIHLLKPALRASDVYEFAGRQKHRYVEYGGGIAYPVWTSRKPARLDDLLNGGSLYWIVKKAVQVRQSIVGFENYEGDEKGDKPSYLIMCDTALVRTQPIMKKPFQGWRYLQPSNAPVDIAAIHEVEERPPPEMETVLREAGLL